MAARMRDAWVGKVGCMPGTQVQLAGRRNRMIRPPIFAEADHNGKANVPLAAGKRRRGRRTAVAGTRKMLHLPPDRTL